MRNLNPITVDDTQYFDVRGIVDRDRRREAVKIIQKQTDIRFDGVVATGSGAEPGCSSLRTAVARREFELSNQALSGDRDFYKWRKQREAQRLCVDIHSPENFRMFVRDHSGPLGGIMIYNVVILGKVEGVIQYRAGCGPLIEDVEKAADFMLYLLENSTPGENDKGDPIVMQLMGWSFPIEDERNRWDVSRVRLARYLTKFQVAHDVTLETRGNQEFITSLRKFL